MPRTLKDCQEGCSFLLPFFSIIRLTYPPNLLPRADKKKNKNKKKNTVRELYFWLILHPRLARCLFPQLVFTFDKETDLYFLYHSLGLLLLWWAVDTCLFKQEILAHEVWAFFFLHDVYYSISDCLKKTDWTAKRAGDHRAERPCSGDGKMASISL